MSTVALIPARGGSKRLPRKNILDVAGRPLLAYSIETAKKSGLFDHLYVSTEDDEIAAVAEQYGAELIERPACIAEDRSSVVEVCLHALEVHSEIEQMCCIYPTSFLLQMQILEEAYEILNTTDDVDFVMGVSEYEYSPVQALRADNNGYLSYMWPEWQGIQSQFYPTTYVSNGTFYWAKTAAFIRERTFCGKRLKGLVVPENQVSDINTEEDLRRVMCKLPL